jgi:hypothetical protein
MYKKYSELNKKAFEALVDIFCGGGNSHGRIETNLQYQC